MEIRTVAFLEIITMILIVLSIVGITLINKRVGYGQEHINNAQRYVDINQVADALDRFKKLEVGSEKIISEKLTADNCLSSGVSIEKLSDILIPEYIDSFSYHGPNKDPYLASYDKNTKLFTICAPESEDVDGEKINISITR